jgi:hypothetical protein
MNRITTLFYAFFALALMHGPALHAAEALLIPEVITREISIHVGGIQSPEIQYVETRELSLFVGEEPEPPYRQVESREVSLVVSDAAPPPRIEQLEVTLSPTGDEVTLDWSGYDQYAVRDVVRYDIYYSARAFADITGMTPFASVGGENFLWNQGGFPQWQDHFFAVVPVDGQGNRISQIVYFGGYPLMPETMTREVSLFIGAEPEPPYRHVESREVSLVVSDPSAPPRIQELEVTLSPTGDVVTLDWTGYDQWAVRDVVRYDIYYSDRAFADITGMTPFSTVGGENFLWTQGGFPRWQDHFFAVVPVDGEGNQIRQIVYFGAYPLMPETMTREVSLFIGEEPEPPYRMLESREVGLVVADDTIPAAVTGAGKVFDANISEHQYGGVYLNWNDYDLWAQRDVIGYRIYYSDRFFSNVNESGVQFAGLSQDGLMATMVSGAFEPKVYYFAVVAEDAAGNFDPLVYSRSTKDPIPSLWEFALGNVKIGSSSLADLGITWSVEENHIEYRYARRNLAVEAGTSFLVEWSEDLENWYIQGVSQIITVDNGEIQTIKALVPRSGRAKLFVRLKVVPNTGQSGSGGQGVSVTPIAPPQIIAQPTGVEILSGSTTTLSVKVNSTAPRTYQWYRGNRGDTSSPVGTNASTFVTPALTADTRYWVRISNAAGSVDSNAAWVAMATAPVINTQPASVTIASGQSGTMSVTATGSTPLIYQWYQGALGVTSTPVGSNSASFTTPSLNATTSYWVRVSNFVGAINSAACTVSIYSPPNTSEVVAVYSAGNTGVAPNPASSEGGSWVAGSPTSDVANFQSAGLSPDGATGFNAWRMFDNSTAQSQFITWNKSITPQQHLNAASKGWQLSARLRVNDPVVSNGGSNSVVLLYGNNSNKRWVMFFDLNPAGQIVTSFLGGSSVTLVGVDSSAHNLHELIYNPASGASEYFVNGQSKLTGYMGTTGAYNGIQWGTGSTAGRGDGYWNSVSFSLKP